MSELDKKVDSQRQNVPKASKTHTDGGRLHSDFNQNTLQDIAEDTK